MKTIFNNKKLFLNGLKNLPHMKNPAILKKSSFLLVIFTFLIFQSCELFGDDDDLPQLPDATQNGKGTFGCLINGMPFVVTNTSQMVAIYQNGGLVIGGQLNDNNKLKQISIFLSESNLGKVISQNNSYILNSNKVPKGEYYDELNDCFYFTSTSHTGTIEITHFDKINYTISGKFNFNGYSDDCFNSIKITEGRFDLNYIP